jgi:hypothetical protein
MRTGDARDDESQRELDRWLDRMEREDVPEPAATTDNKTRPATVDGCTVTFHDARGGLVALSPAGGLFQHKGTVGVRGPQAPDWTSGCHAKVSASVMRALEFVAAWFGAPFDAVNVSGAPNVAPNWGFWRFGGRHLAAALGLWKDRDPEGFANLLGRFGVGISKPAAEAEGAQEPAALTIETDRAVLRGESARELLVCDPIACAALARAGRDLSAQSAQIDIALSDWVVPLLRLQTASKGGSTIEEVFSTPRSLAPLVYLVRRHGVRRTSQFVQEAEIRPDADEQTRIQSIVDLLQVFGRAEEVCEVLRIASSPELREP